MNKEEYDALVAKLGKEAADQIKAHAESIEKQLNQKFADMQKGLITAKELEDLKKEIAEGELKTINEKLAAAEETAIEQGKQITELKDGNGKKVKKSLEEFLGEKITEITKFRKAKSGFFEITSSELKAAGVTSIGSSIADMDTPIGSPYSPGIGGAELQLFDIQRDPNFIINHVDLGRTNQFRLAWINETVFEGSVNTDIAEGGLKSLTQHKFKVEFSEAKKAAAYIELTEEFEQDVPGLASAVRRMLKDDVIRQWDTDIQADVIAAARPYEITQLDETIQDANLWSALRAMEGQVGFYNYMTNTFAINPLTGVMVDEQKNQEGTYLLPPFMDRVRPMIVEANKVAFDNALVGDLKQYKVDIYKDFVITIGWINDDFIRNKFAVLGEMRYHSYISDARKKALVYDDISEVRDRINSGS